MRRCSARRWSHTAWNSPSWEKRKIKVEVVRQPSQERKERLESQGPIESARAGTGRRKDMEILAASERSSSQLFRTAQTGVMGQITDHNATYPNFHKLQFGEGSQDRAWGGCSYLNDHFSVVSVNIVLGQFSFFPHALQVCLFFRPIISPDILIILMSHLARMTKHLPRKIGQKILHCKPHDLSRYRKINELSLQPIRVDRESGSGLNAFRRFGEGGSEEFELGDNVVSKGDYRQIRELRGE
jgi:hypothetical protein